VEDCTSAESLPTHIPMSVDGNVQVVVMLRPNIFDCIVVVRGLSYQYLMSLAWYDGASVTSRPTLNAP